LQQIFFLSCYFTTEPNKALLTPSPPNYLITHSRTLNSKLKPIFQLSRYGSNSKIKDLLGDGAFSLLKWILFTNRAHFITLPDQLKITPFQNYVQFMTLLSTPEAEVEFLERKKKYGSVFLWHGSSGERWYPIQRMGLKNVSGTSFQKNGAAHEKGIYLSPESSTSLSYVIPVLNLFPQSQFKVIKAIALCEVAKVKDLIAKTTNISTLQDEKAIIMRFLFLMDQNQNIHQVDLRKTTISAPTLKDILDAKKDYEINCFDKH
jgi:hypothetical protein